MTTPYDGPGAAVVVAALGPAQYTQLPGGIANTLVFTGHCALLGYSVSAGAAAGSIVVSDATAEQGLGVASEQLAANSSQTRWFGPQGIDCTRGLYVQTGGANTITSVYYQPLPDD